MRILLFCIILLFSLQATKAQQLFIQKYPTSVYQGATQSWGMAEDKQGLLYVANNDGVIKYDGQKWDLITLPNQNYVFSLAFNSKYELYVGSYGEFGFLKKDSTANWQYHSLTGLIPQQYRDFKDIRQTIVFNDEVFYNNLQNIYCYRNGRVKVFPIANQFLYKVKKQLFIIRGKNLLEYKNGTFENAGFDNDLSSISLKRVAAFDNGTYLLLDNSSSVWVLDPSKSQGNRLRLLTAAPSVLRKGDAINAMLYLDNGNIALRSGDGIVLINKNGKVVNSNLQDMLGVNKGTGFFFQDSHHNLWIGNDANISQIFTSSPVSFYDKQNGLNGIVLSLGKKGNYLYAGTDKGLFYKNGNSAFTMVPGTENENWNLFNFNQKLFLAHASGVFDVEGGKATRLITHRYVQTLGQLTNRPDCMMMGTYDTGIWLLEKEGNRWLEKKITGFEEETRFIQQDYDGSIWISHYNKGIFKLRLNGAMDSVLNKTLYDSSKGLPSNLNNRIYRLNNGRIIVTTVNGIYCFNKIKNKFEPDPLFSKIAGGNICIYTLTETAGGDIYFWGAPSKNIETAGAFLKQANGAFKLLLTPFSKNATHTNDLRIDVDAPVLVASPNEVWAGNQEKIISYNPSQKTYYHEPVKLFIKQVQAGNALIFKNGARLREMDIPFSKNTLKFNYTSSYYEDADKIEYQYKLDGFENKWGEWGAENEAVFTNLSNGNYTFWVRAKNIYGQVSQPVSFSFYVNAPWYKSWWTYFLYFIAAIGFLQFAITFNTGRIKRQRSKLKQLVDIKTQELRKKADEVSEKNLEILAQSKNLQELNLTKDKLFSIISHDLRGPIGQLKQTFDLIELGGLSESEFKSLIPGLNESIGSAFSLTDNLLYWARSQMEGLLVNPVKLDLAAIAEENYHLFKPRADTKNIRLINNINTGTVAYGDRDMITLVLRNLVNNAIKFTNSGGTVTIGSSDKAGQTAVYVKDTGTGLSPAELQSILHKKNFHKDGTSGEKGSGLGLMLCLDFIEKNGGKINVDSELGKGSTFSFSLPTDKD